MCVMLWPQEAGQLSVPEIWKHIHQQFSQTDHDVQFAAINDDLVGFFNSVPQSRLLDAIQQLTTEWVNQHGETQVSVNMALKGPVVHTSFVGQCKKTSPNIKPVRVQDILTIVQASLSTHAFKAISQIWVQHRGAGIGSHISPSLSNLAVTLIERSWRNAYSTFIQSSQPQLLFTRYVDNRFILFDHRFRSALPMQVLSDCFFYQAPVELETVQDGTLLGFIIDVVQRTVRYQVPPLWKIRDLHSAGSMRLRLSGLKSRATLIRRYTFPKQFVRSQPTHSAVCTERVLQNRLPTRLVQKAIQAYLNFWLWKIATDTLMRLQMFQCGFLQITCWCLASTQLKEHKPGYVPFCVCQALYQRVLHLLWLTSTNLFLAAFFHKLLIPLCLLIHSRGHKDLWWVLCQWRHSPQVVKTYLHDAPGWHTQYVGVIAGGHIRIR